MRGVPSDTDARRSHSGQMIAPRRHLADSGSPLVAVPARPEVAESPGNGPTPLSPKDIARCGWCRASKWAFSGLASTVKATPTKGLNR